VCRSGFGAGYGRRESSQRGPIDSSRGRERYLR
jgi:hypothetical protein